VKIRSFTDYKAAVIRAHELKVEIMRFEDEIEDVTLLHQTPAMTRLEKSFNLPPAAHARLDDPDPEFALTQSLPDADFNPKPDPVPLANPESRARTANVGSVEFDNA